MITLNSQPESVAYSRNPLFFAATTSKLLSEPGLAIKADIYFNNTLQLTLTLRPDSNRQVRVNASQLAESLLEYTKPGTNLVAALDSQVGTCKVIFGEVTTAVPTDPLPKTSNDILVIKGGLSYELWRSDFWSLYTESRKQYFSWHDSGRKVAAWQRTYLNYLHLAADISTVELLVEVTYTDETTDSKTYTPFVNNSLEENKLYRIATGFEAIKLDLLQPTKEPWHYTITLKDSSDDSTIYPAYTYYIDATPDYEKISFNFQSSLGLLESIRLTGEHDMSEQRDSIDTEVYVDGITESKYLPSQFYNSGLTLQEKTKSSIGWTDEILFQELRRDLFYSREVWRFKNRRFWPVIILNKEYGRGRLSAQVRDMEVEWAAGNRNENYSRADIDLGDNPLQAVNDAYEVYVNDVLTVAARGILANDIDDNTATLKATAGAFATDHGSITINEDGSFAYTPEADYVGPDSYTYTVTNQFGETDTAIININVKEMEPGMILMWAGDPGAVPSGWALCDGSGGTPDLSGMFIVGYNAADADYDAIGKTGGSKTHTLTIAQMPEHGHYIRNGQTGSSTNPLDAPVSGFSGTDELGSWIGSETADSNWLGATGDGEAHPNRPPFYTLAYIIKL